ncbi:MAG: putative transcriptional regulator of viral defense system [Bacteroidia bacterium]|jgi:predicted transcriptional regulator of viral defense system
MGVVAEFVRELQSYEEYSFSTEELYQKTAAPASSVKKELARLVANNQIINLRKGFYLILPPSYQHYKKLPLELYIDKLFKSLNKPYYVAHYSAAASYGASHQQIQQDYIITDPPALRDIAKENIKLRFFNSSVWPKGNVLDKKSSTGYFKISSPALTFADLLENQNNLGGINRMLAILGELCESITKQDLEELLAWYDNKSTLQRMGFLLEQMEWNAIHSDKIFKSFKNGKIFPTLLTPHHGQKAGSAGNRWKIDQNTIFESCLQLV